MKNVRSPLRPGSAIVVGVDESGLSDDAVRRGEELGKVWSARVHLVHAAPALPEVWPGMDPARGEALSVECLDAARKHVGRRVRSVLEEAARTRAPSAGGVLALDAPPETDRVEVWPGPPAQVLLERVRAEDAGLLVLGTHRKRAFLDFGNTLRAVYAKSTVPVWVQPGAIEPIRRIVAAVDLSEESLAALAAACVLGRTFGASIRAVHVFRVDAAVLAGVPGSTWETIDYPIERIRTAERESFEGTMRDFDWKGVAHETEFADGEPAGILLDRAGEADLVVLGTHGRTGLASVVLGGVAYSVLKQATKPTLAVPRPRRSFRI